MARILIAEDDEAIRKFMARALERAGHEVMAVGDGASALQVIRKNTLDLLVADIVMPELDGVALSRKAMAIDENLRVIFITGFSAVAMNIRQTESGKTKVLSKPFHLKDLVAAIERELAAATHASGTTPLA